MAHIIISVFLFIIIIFSMQNNKKSAKAFNAKRDTFVAYLDSVNDTDTLKVIGEINMFGKRERFYPAHVNIVKYLEKKIESTDDNEKYKEYLDAYEDYSSSELLNLFGFFIPLFIIANFILDFIKQQ